MKSSKLGVWWAIAWRLVLLIGTSLYVAELMPRPSSSIVWIYFRPSVFWLWIAVLVYGLRNRVFGGITLERTDFVVRGICLFLIFLAILNAILAFAVSTAVWVDFKIFAPVPLLLAFIAVLVRAVVPGDGYAARTGSR